MAMGRESLTKRNIDRVNKNGWRGPLSRPSSVRAQVGRPRDAQTAVAENRGGKFKIAPFEACVRLAVIPFSPEGKEVTRDVSEETAGVLVVVSTIRGRQRGRIRESDDLSGRVAGGDVLCCRLGASTTAAFRKLEQLELRLLTEWRRFL